MNAPIAKALDHYIGGKRIAGTSGRSSPVYHPASGAVDMNVPLASVEEVGKAVAAAKAAFPAWAETSALRRARVMFKFKELLDKHRDELAAMINRQHGKVFADAQGEVTRGIEVVEFACGITSSLKGEHSDQ